MDKAIDLFLATFLLLIIVLLTLIATNFILANMFKKLDNVFAINVVKSMMMGWAYNPGFPGDDSTVPKSDPVWQYGGFAYAEYRPIINTDLGIVYTPPLKVYPGVLDPMKLLHLNTVAMQSNYVELKRFLGIPDGVEYNLYIEMPFLLKESSYYNFYNYVDAIKDYYVDKKEDVKYLHNLQTSPLNHYSGDVEQAGFKCGAYYCLPDFEKVTDIHKYYINKKLINEDDIQYIGMSYGIIPYRGTLLSDLVYYYQKELDYTYYFGKPKVTNLVAGDLGYRADVSIEGEYPLYSKYMYILSPSYAKQFPQFSLLKLETILSNSAYKSTSYKDDDSHILVRLVYLPINEDASIQQHKPFDILVEVMFIPNVPDPEKVKVKEVDVVVEQDDLGAQYVKIYKPPENSNSTFYVFTFHWYDILKKYGYGKDDSYKAVKKVSGYYDGRLPLKVKVFVRYEYLGELKVKAYTLDTTVYELYDVGTVKKIMNSVYSGLYSFRHLKDALSTWKKLIELSKMFGNS